MSFPIKKWWFSIAMLNYQRVPGALKYPEVPDFLLIVSRSWWFMDDGLHLSSSFILPLAPWVVANPSFRLQIPPVYGYIKFVEVCCLIHLPIQWLVTKMMTENIVLYSTSIYNIYIYIQSVLFLHNYCIHIYILIYIYINVLHVIYIYIYSNYVCAVYIHNMYTQCIH